MQSKFFCIFLIICFMPQCILSIGENFGKVISTNYNPLYIIRDWKFNLKNLHINKIDCILEYILETRIVQTELYVDNLHHEMVRRIVANDEMKMLKIHKNEMTKYWKIKKRPSKFKNTDECFSMNKQALDGDGNILSMEKLFSLTKNRLILSEKWRKKLDLLQSCLLNFFVVSKFFNYEHFETILLNKSNGKTREEQKILNAFKFINGKNKKDVVLQWKWGTKGKPKQEEAIYEEGDEGFEKLKKCEQMKLFVKKNSDVTNSKYEPSSSTSTKLEVHDQRDLAELKGKMIAKEKEKIDLMDLLKYFNDKQLFLRMFPNVLFYAENKFPEKECPICLEEYSENDKLKRFYCGHYFHWDCMQTNTRQNNNYTCPICRADLRD